MEERYDKRFYYVFNAFAEYAFEPEDSDHYFKAMVGFNQEKGDRHYLRGKAYSLITPQVLNINATVGAQEAYSGASHVSLRGAFYRLNYIFKDKYLVELNGRYDASSRFPTDVRYDFFPSFSAGWRISEEPFVADLALNWLDQLKIKGLMENLEINYLEVTIILRKFLQWDQVHRITVAAGNRAPYVSPAGLVSSDLTWETVASTNFGIDATLLDNRLDVSFDVFTENKRYVDGGRVSPNIRYFCA